MLCSDAYPMFPLQAGIAKLVARDSPVRDASLQGPILSRLISSLRSKAKDTDTTVR